MFSFNRYCQIVSQPFCTNLHSPEMCEHSSCFKPPPTLGIYSVLLVHFSHPDGCCGVALWLHWSLVIHEAEPLLVFMLPIWISAFVNHLFKFLAHFSIDSLFSH